MGVPVKNPLNLVCLSLVHINFSLNYSTIATDGFTHMHSLEVYVKEGLSFARDLSLENSADSYVCFRLALLHSVSYFFFLY